MKHLKLHIGMILKKKFEFLCGHNNIFSKNFK
jgi:hypothetical protein